MAWTLTRMSAPIRYTDVEGRSRELVPGDKIPDDVLSRVPESRVAIWTSGGEDGGRVRGGATAAPVAPVQLPDPAPPVEADPDPEPVQGDTGADPGQAPADAPDPAEEGDG